MHADTPHTAHTTDRRKTSHTRQNTLTQHKTTHTHKTKTQHTPPPPYTHTHTHTHTPPPSPHTRACTHMHATHTQHIEPWPVCGLAGVPPPPQTQAGCSTTAWSPAHPGCHSCTGGEPPWPGHSSHARSPPQSPTKSSAQTVNHLGQDIHHVHVLHRKVLQVQHRQWTILARTFITCMFSTAKSYNKYNTDGEPPWPGHSSRAHSLPQSPTSSAQTGNHLGQDIHHVHVLYRNVLQLEQRRLQQLAPANEAKPRLEHLNVWWKIAFVRCVLKAAIKIIKISEKVLPPVSWDSWAGPPCLWCSAWAATCGTPRAETSSPDSTHL